MCKTNKQTNKRQKETTGSLLHSYIPSEHLRLQLFMQYGSHLRSRWTEEQPFIFKFLLLMFLNFFSF